MMLGIAAADRHNGLGMVPAAPADDGPVLLIRHGGDGTGVDDIAVAGFLKLTDAVAHIQQQSLHGLCLILICLTAEGIEGKFHY